MEQVTYYTEVDEERNVPTLLAIRAEMRRREAESDEPASLHEAYRALSRSLAVLTDGDDLDLFVLDYADRIRASLDSKHGDAWLDGVALARRFSPWFDGEIRSRL